MSEPLASLGTRPGFDGTRIMPLPLDHCSEDDVPPKTRGVLVLILRFAKWPLCGPEICKPQALLEVLIHLGGEAFSVSIGRPALRVGRG